MDKPKKYTIKTIAVHGISIRYTVPVDMVTSILFLGVGQKGKNLTWIADDAPEGTVIVEAAPYASMKTSDKVVDLGISVVGGICERFHLQELTVFAESQAAPAAILALCRADQLPRALVGISPLGLSYHQQGSSESARTRKMLKGSMRFWSGKGQRLTSKANAETFQHAVLRHLLTPLATIRAFHTAANLHVQHEAEAIARQIPLHVFAGTHDELFSYQDIKRQLTDSTAIRLHELPDVGHVNRATPRGIEQFQKIHQSIMSV